MTPAFLYGTAWKEEATQRLVSAALDAGFRGIDTANQRKHYHEVAVGAALREAFARGLKRDSLFLQTKFTHLDGQDHRLPYDKHASVTIQVEQSFKSSLEHLGVDSLDSYVLHGPSLRVGLAPEDLEAWYAMEALHATGAVTSLGVSNVSRGQLELLCEEASIPPAFVQNRCYAKRGWDRDVREFCRANHITYQGFSLLTANASELSAPSVARIAVRLGCTTAQLVFAFARAVGMVCLTGTSDTAHMQEDLASARLELTPADVALIERIAG